MEEPIDNARIIRFLRRHAALMELAGLNAFRVRAFDNASRLLEELEVDISEMSAAGTLTGIDGIGKGVAAFVAEFIDRGTAAAYEALTEQIPETLLDLLRIPGLGQKKVRALYDSLGIATLGELEAACRDGRLGDLPGFGARTQESILRGIAGLTRFRGRWRYDQAIADARKLLQALAEHPRTIRASLAGSLRRHREVVKEIDIVLSTEAPGEVAGRLAGLPGVVEVIARGERKLSVRLESGVQADLRLVEDCRFPSMLHHFTGSRDHNAAMRSRALARGMHLNENGLFHGREGGGEAVPCRREEDLFRDLGLSYVPPELREGLGEVEAAAAGKLPRLLTAADMRGMLHVHTRASDGVHTLEEMVDAVRLRGHEYVAVCDHSKSAGYVYGMKEEDVEAQHREIDALQAKRGDIRILKGIESEVARDGSLDYDDDFLERFDLVVAAVHDAMAMDRGGLTRRVVRALEHPATTILAHPTGRVLLERDGFPLDLEEILAAAAAHGVAVELNTQPSRLDLDWRWLRRARDLGVRIAVNTDAHRIAHLDHLELGVGIARKGWLTAGDVINTLPAEDLLAWARRGG